MTANSSVTKRVLDAIVPGLLFFYRDLRALDCLRGIEDMQLRNALVSLQANGRVLKLGTHAHYRYYLNPSPPLMRADAARATRQAFADSYTDSIHARDVAPAIAPTWPAIHGAIRFDRNPAWRIAA